MAAKLAFVLGTLPFMILGIIHIIYTLIDIQTPKRLTPFDDSVRAAMQRSTLALTKQTTMWRAWLGFNMSHGIGVFFFGFIYLILAFSDFGLLSSVRLLLYLSVVISVSYVILSVNYWFNIPTIGCGIGAVCFIVSLILA